MLAVWLVAAHGWLLYFGDAEAHLNIARRLVDNQTPGWDQLGSPWLPLPHLLMAPFAARGAMWRSGLAGSVPGAACFIAAAGFLFCAVEEWFGSPWPAWTAMLVFVLNPNALYLQSTAMTEPVFAAALCGLLYFTVRFRRTGSVGDVAGAGLCALAGTWTRYEGWLLLPFCALYFLDWGKWRWRACLLFCAISAVGPVSWLYYNWWLTGNALDFYNGASSAKAIQGGASYPGFHDWPRALLYYRTCVRLVLGSWLFWVAGVGLIAAGLRRAWWPVILLAAPPVFYVWSVHSSYVPIHVPELPPHSWYNTRYGLAALPLAAFCAGAITRAKLGLAAAGLALLPWVAAPSPQNWITWKESEQNSISRRAWTQESADWLRGRVQPGEHIAAEFNDTMGIFRYAGIPLRQVFHPGNTLLWEAAMRRPDLFLNTTWIVCQRASWSTLASTAAHAQHYQLVKSVAVPGAPSIDIYHYAYSIHEGPRSEERFFVDLAP